MDLSDEWLSFIEVELDVFSMSFATFCTYAIIAVICRVIIPASGPVLLRGRYFNDVEQYGYDDNSIANIVFRILAPVFVSYLLLAAAFAIWNAVHSGWSPQIRWMPIVLYWVLYIVMATAKHSPSYPVWTLVTQALTSLFAALYFDWAVVCRIPEEGIIAFDQSNIGWQVLVVSFFAIGALVLFGIKRGLSRYNDRLLKSYYLSSVSPSSSEGISPKVERRLFSYLRSFDALLPDDFKRDVLLRSLFYTIMYIEDSNRPKWFRLLERMFFWTGFVKSTGIMQVRSQEVLSDTESIEQAIPLVRDIWNSFVVQVAKSNVGNHFPKISFSDSWYRYNYSMMRDEVAQSASYLYGEYCGTFTLDISKAFLDITKFINIVDDNYRINDVYVNSNLFKAEASWLPGRELCFDEGCISLLAVDVPRNGTVLRIANNRGIDKDEAKRTAEAVAALTTIESVEYIPDVRCVITSVEVGTPDEAAIAKIASGWIISIMKSQI